MISAPLAVLEANFFSPAALKAYPQTPYSCTRGHFFFACGATPWGLAPRPPIAPLPGRGHFLFACGATTWGLLAPRPRTAALEAFFFACSATAWGLLAPSPPCSCPRAALRPGCYAPRPVPMTRSHKLAREGKPGRSPAAAGLWSCAQAGMPCSWMRWAELDFGVYIYIDI